MYWLAKRGLGYFQTSIRANQCEHSGFTPLVARHPRQLNDCIFMEHFSVVAFFFSFGVSLSLAFLLSSSSVSIFFTTEEEIHD
jgi:hypothetical protein